jgi:AhpD family alkylhydroperoxidase
VLRKELAMGFEEAVEQEGALDVKTKKLIAVSLAVAQQCEWCIAMHTNVALETGATVGELVEACMVAIFMGGTPAMMHTKLVLDMIKELQG